MANFAVAASQQTIETANKVMEMYAMDGDKKEDTLLRILNLAAKEAVKGTHPALEGKLNDVDSTITTLIKQIGGIVAGQDFQIADLKDRLEKALEEKQTALDKAKSETEAANAMAEQSSKDAQAAKQESASSIKQAQDERDQAVRERDDARAIAEEKTSSNNLLMRQMAALEADADAYKKLKEEYSTLQDRYNSLVEKSKDDARTASDQLKDAQRDLKDAKIQSELAIEKAISEKEREMNDQLRQADKENAKLQAKIEMLEDRVRELSNA